MKLRGMLTRWRSASPPVEPTSPKRPFPAWRLDVPPQGSLGLLAQPGRAGVKHWRACIEQLLYGQSFRTTFWHSQDLITSAEALRSAFDLKGVPRAHMNDEALLDFAMTDRAELIDRIAFAIIQLDGRVIMSAQGDDSFDPHNMLTSLVVRTISPIQRSEQAHGELVGFIKRNAEAIVEALRVEFDARVQSDLILFRHAAECHPHLSVEELRHTINRPQLSRSYVQGHIAPHLNLDRPVDRYGDEPNLLLAIAIANVMIRAPVGTDLEQVVRTLYLEHPWVKTAWPDLSIEDLSTLAQCYPAIPKWPHSAGSREVRKSSEAPNATDLPEHMMAALRELSHIPGTSKLLEAQSQLRDETPPLIDHEVVSVELAANDVVGYLDHLIRRLGGVGANTTIIWKPYADDTDHPADRLLPRLSERMFGIRSVAPSFGEDLAKITEVEIACGAARAEAAGRKLAAHVLGVQDWTGIARVARHAPQLRPKIIAHTSSDHDAFERADLGELCVVNMADAPAKHLYERQMLGDSIATALFEVEQALNMDIRHRDFLVHGMGRTVGPAVLIALDRMGIPREKIHVSDPALSDAAIADLGVQRPANIKALFKGPLVSINATPEHVLTDEMLEAISPAHPLVHVQFGSNRKDVQAVERQSVGEAVSPIGRQVITRYALPENAEGTRIVYLPGDGKVLNHAFRRPIPTERTDFINLLKTEAWYQAAHLEAEGAVGPQRMSSVHVVFDPQERGRQPIVLLMPRGWGDEPLSLHKVRALAKGQAHDQPLALACFKDGP